MGASSSGTDSVTQKSEPWAASQPYLKDIFGQAQGMYNQGQQYFPGSTVVPFSPNTQAGMAGLKDQFSQTPLGLDTAMNTMDRVSQGTTGNPVYNQMQQAANAQTTAGTGMIGASASPTTAGTGMIGASAGVNPFLSQINAAGNQQTTAGVGTLNQMQSGGNNPYLDQIFNKAASQVRDNTNAMFSKAGRYGSTANQNALSDSLGNMAANMYGNAYESDAGRRMAAASQLAGIQQNDINRQLGTAQTLAGLGENQYGRMAGAGSTLAGIQQSDLSRMGSAGTALAGLQANDLNRQLGGLGQLAGYGQQGDQMAMQAAMLYPQLSNYAQSGNRGLMELGGMQEQQAGAELQDAMNRWNFGQTGGWDLLNRYNSIVQPMAALGGTSTQSQPGQSALGAGLQGAAGGALAGSTFGPWGAAIGGGLGALGGLI